MGQSDTRAEILELARAYLQKLGFNAFSFQTIADQLGIRKASIHYHFKSKEEMGLALVDGYVAGFRQWADGRKRKDRGPLRDLEAYFRLFESICDDRTKICPLGVLSADWNTLPEIMKERLRVFHLEQRQWLMMTLERGETAGEFSLTATPGPAADLVLSALQGALQISRVRGEAAPLANVRVFIIRQLTGGASARRKRSKPG